MQKNIKILASLLLTLIHIDIFAIQEVDTIGRVPVEIETAGGQSMAYAFGGAAQVSGLGAIRTNPAMLATKSQYQLIAGYHWPTQGREFYQLGIVDSKTAKFAAGVLWSSYREHLDVKSFQQQRLSKKELYYDSPVSRRISAALAHRLYNVYLGVSAHYIEFINNNQKDSDISLGLGAAMEPMHNLKVSMSAENLSNKDLSSVAPSIYRLGASYSLAKDKLSFHLDYRQRQRLLKFETPMGVSSKDLVEDTKAALAKSERMLIASASAVVADMVKLIGGYAYALDKSKRRSLAGGIALVNQAVSFSYIINQPYVSQNSYHHAVNLSYNVAL